MTKLLIVPLWVHGVGIGQIIVTSGLQNMGEEFLKRAVSAMCCFDPFTEDNDPNGEPILAPSVCPKTSGEKLFWKVDYYDLVMSPLAERGQPWCARGVPTLMLQIEY